MQRCATIAEIPGYLAALEQEQFERDAAFLLPHEVIAGQVVQPITLRAYAELRLAGTPFLPPFPDPTPEQLVQLLWRNSPGFARHNARALARFVRGCRPFLPPPAPWFSTRRGRARWHAQFATHARRFEAAVVQAQDFMRRMLADAPRTRAGGGGDPAPFSDLAGVTARLARAFGWSESAIMELPLPRIFQYLRDCDYADYAANARAGLKAEPPLFFGRADKIVDDYMAARNRAEMTAANQN